MSELINYNPLEALVFRGHKFTPIINNETGEPWFLGKEVQAILELRNLSDAIKNAGLEEDESTIVLNDSGVGGSKMTLLSESGLYGLIGNSRKQIGKDLRKFVRKQVLPSIRKTGQFKMPETQEERMIALAHQIIEMSTKNKSLEIKNQLITEQRDKAVTEKAYVQAGREGTLLSRLGRLASIEEVVNIVRKSCEFVDDNKYIKPSDLAENLRLFLEIKKLPLNINEILFDRDWETPKS